MNHLILSPGWVILAQLLFTGFLCVKNPRDARYEKLFLLSFVSFLGILACGLLFLNGGTQVNIRYDQYLFVIDKAFGNPGFYLARFLNEHSLIREIAVTVYQQSCIPMFGMLILYWTKLPKSEAYTFTKTLTLNFPLAIPLYLLCPASGPAFAFKDFPNVIPDISTPHVMSIPFIPNCMPSVHTSTALLVLVFLWRWKLGKAFGIFWVAFTVLATLGLGEHYFIDLIAAVPYTVGILYLAGYEPARIETPSRVWTPTLEGEAI